MSFSPVPGSRKAKSNYLDISTESFPFKLSYPGTSKSKVPNIFSDPNYPDDQLIAGGLSGLWYDAGVNRYFTVSDVGPQAQDIPEEQGFAFEGEKVFNDPDFKLQVTELKYKIKSGKASVKDTTTLRVPDGDGGFRDAKQQRIKLARQQIGREAPRYTGKGRGDPGNGVPARGMEQDPCQWNEHHIGGVCREVAQHADGHDQGSKQCLWSIAHTCSHGGSKQPGAFCHPGTQHHDQHIAQWMEVGEGFGHVDPQPRNVLGRQQTGGINDALAAGGGINLGGMRCRYACEARNYRDNDEKQNEPKKEKDRIGQLVALSFNPAEHTADGLCVSKALRSVGIQKPLPCSTMP